MFDSARLAAYLRRIGISAPRRPTLHALRRIHRAHIDAIPYENLDIQLSRPVRLDEDSLYAKLVEGGRGGYCFEQNGTLAHALEAMGFDVRRVLGAVGREAEGDGNWWNHMPLVVRLASGDEYLVDTGLGTAFRDPMPIKVGNYRVGAFNYGLWRIEDGLWRCSFDARVANQTFDFSLRARAIEEFAEKCRELATSPDSPFVKTLTVQRSGEARMTVLRARTFTVYDPSLPDDKEARTVERAEDFAEILTGHFGLNLADEEVSALWAKAKDQHERRLAEDREQARTSSGV